MTAPRGTAPTAATAALAVTDASVKAVAAAVLAGAPADPRVAALCRWALAADVAGLRRELAAARTEAALARDDFHRLRALRADHASSVGDPDTIDDDLSDAVPLLLDDDDKETLARQAATIRIHPTLRPTRRSVSVTDGSP